MILGTNHNAPEGNDSIEPYAKSVRVDILPEYMDLDLDIIMSRFSVRPGLSPMFIARSMVADVPKLVERARQVFNAAKGLHQPFDIEIGNEPDHSGTAGEWSTHPKEFGDACDWAHNDLRERGFRGSVYAGGVTSLGAWGYLEKMDWSRMPDGLSAAWHMYDTHGRFLPPKGFASWDDAFASAKKIVGESRPFAVTEFGCPATTYKLSIGESALEYLKTGKFTRTRTVTPEDAAQMIQDMLTLGAHHGATVMHQYLFRDDPPLWGLVDKDNQELPQGKAMREWSENTYQVEA